MNRAGAALLLLLLAGCNEGLDPQKRYGVLSQAIAPWPSSGEALSPPDGTVAQGDAALDAAAATPPAVTPALLARGRDRFAIFCAPCHGLDGYGGGIIVARGFPKPVSFHDPGLRDAPAARLFGAISMGYGAMYSYGDRVAPADRWAIVAYIRALQLSQLDAKETPP